MTHLTKKRSGTKKMKTKDMIHDDRSTDVNFLIQMCSKGYSEWLGEENDIYDELFKDEVK